MKHLARFVGLVAVLSLATWFVAWWTVPIVGAAWGAWRRDDVSAPLAAGLAAMVAWGALIAVSASGAPAGSVMDAVGTAMGVGPMALLALTVAFPGLLAASAAGAVRAVVGRRG